MQVENALFVSFAKNFSPPAVKKLFFNVNDAKNREKIHKFY